MVRIALGVLIVFIVPGFALVCAVLPERQFSSSERLLASVGASVAVAISVAVLLGATPVGLSRLSFSVVLGICTLIFSDLALYRSGVGYHARRGLGGDYGRDGILNARRSGSARGL